MDIKAKIEEIVEKLKSDKTLLEGFKSDPIATVEKLIGIDLPNEQLEKIVEGIKAKIDIDKVTKLLDSDGDGKLEVEDAKNILGKLGSLFGKK